MSLPARVLAFVVAVELFACGGVASWRMMRSRPPVPEFGGTSELAASDLRALAANCRSPGDWRELGEAYLATGFFREAEACYRVAHSSEPTNATGVFELAFAQERLAQLEETNQNFQRAADLGYAHPQDCFHLIGRNLLRMEKVSEARAAFEKAGDLPASIYALARLDWQAGKLDAAQQKLDQLLTQDPSAMQPLWLKQLIGRELGMYRDSYAVRDRWERSSQRLANPFDRDASRLTERNQALGPQRRFLEAQELLQQNNYAAAESLLRQTLEASWNGHAADQLSECLYQQGRIDDSAVLLQEIIERDGPSVNALERLGDMFSDLGNLSEARTAWQRAAELGPGTTSKDAHFKLGYSLDKTGDKERASRCLAAGNASHGVDLLREGRFDEARVMLDRSIEADPLSDRAWFFLGELHRLRGNAAEAIRAYEKCLQLKADHGRCLAALEYVSEMEPP